MCMCTSDMCKISPLVYDGCSISADILHAYVSTRLHPYALTSTWIMLASLYAFICLHMPILAVRA